MKTYTKVTPEFLSEIRELYDNTKAYLNSSLLLYKKHKKLFSAALKYIDNTKVDLFMDENNILKAKHNSNYFCEYTLLAIDFFNNNNFDESIHNLFYTVYVYDGYDFFDEALLDRFLKSFDHVNTSNIDMIDNLGIDLINKVKAVLPKDLNFDFSDSDFEKEFENFKEIYYSKVVSSIIKDHIDEIEYVDGEFKLIENKDAKQSSDKCKEDCFYQHVFIDGEWKLVKISESKQQEVQNKPFNKQKYLIASLLGIIGALTISLIIK